MSKQTNTDTNKVEIETVEFTTERGNVYNIPLIYEGLLPNISAVIRAANADGFGAYKFAKLTSIRPQHVYNVLAQPLKR